DLSSYLFGNILSVTRSDLLLMSILTLVVILVVVILFNDWKAYLFDEEFAYIIGVRTAFLEYLLLILIAMTVVVLIRVVGIILALSLLTIPAAAAAMACGSLKKRMLYAVFLGSIFSVMGLCISYRTNMASGASIVILSALFYLASHFVHLIYSKMKRTRSVLQSEI
ncbi:MAG: metal ABC transporter permease, partial [Eubacteriales bacterium]|nr:metal ABC transporter permease [Eubacteriales bacterium]